MSIRSSNTSQLRKKDLGWWCFVLPTQSCVLMALPNDNVYLPPFHMHMIVIDLVWIETFDSVIFVDWSARRTRTTSLAHYSHQGQADNDWLIASCHALIQSVHICPWKIISRYNIASGQNLKKNRNMMSGQNILTGSKLCWEAIFCQGTILRPDEIFSMDESGVTVMVSLFLI